MAPALTGVRVIEACSGVAGPYLCQLLAEQGAELLKLEPPQGDPYRPSLGFHAVNRSRDSLLLDITEQAERPRLLDLLRHVDLFVHDLSPARRAALRLERDTLAAETHNPGLIVGWLPPFGSAGPHAERPADDALVQAVEGISATQGSSDGLPVYVTPPLSSYGTAIYGAGALTAALLARGADGEGQEVEVSWVAGALALQTGSAVLGQGITRLAAARGNPLGSLPVYRAFRASDGRYLFLACGHSGFFHRFCLLIDHPELISDPRFEAAPWGLVDADARAALAALLEPIFLEQPRDEWLRRLEEADIPCAPVNSRDEYLNDPQVLHNGMRLELDDAELGATVQAGVPLTLPRSPGGVRSAAPPLGNVTASPWRDARPQQRRPSSAEPPLKGVRVLDLSGFIAGALCPMLLGDWGADVIKVEGPDGDPFRAFGYGFLGWNRSKRALCLDLKRPEGQALLHELVRDADVVMENYRPGVAERLGADYATLAAINPRLVYCSGNGYGSSGPYMRKAGFDPLMQARSGAMAAQGGMANGNPPVFLTVAISDYGAALLCAYGIVAALFERERSGQGQHVATALINSVMAMQQVEFLRCARGSAGVEGGPDFRGPSALVRLYGCDGGWLMLAVRDETAWRALVRALDRTDLAELYPAAQALAAPNDGPLAALLAEAFAGDTRDAWLARLDRHGVPVAPVTTGVELFSAPHLLANDLLATHQHPLWGEIVQSGDLAKFSRTRAHVERVAPLLGEHTLELLRESKIDEQRIAALLAAGIVVQNTTTA